MAMAKIIVPLCAVVLGLLGCDDSKPPQIVSENPRKPAVEKGSTCNTSEPFCSQKQRKPTAVEKGFTCDTAEPFEKCMGSITSIADVDKAKDYILSVHKDFVWNGSDNGSDYVVVPKPTAWRCPPNAGSYTQEECRTEMQLAAKIMEVYEKAGTKVKKVYLTPAIQNRQEKLWAVMQKYPHDSVASGSDDLKGLAAYMKTMLATGLGHAAPDVNDLAVVDIFGSGTLFAPAGLQACIDLNDKLLTFQAFNNDPATQNIVYKNCWDGFGTKACDNSRTAMKNTLEGMDASGIATNKETLKTYLTELAINNLTKKAAGSLANPFPTSRSTPVNRSTETLPTYTLTAELKNVPNMNGAPKTQKAEIWFKFIYRLVTGDKRHDLKHVSQDSKQSIFSIDAHEVGGNVKWVNFPVWTSWTSEPIEYRLDFYDGEMPILSSDQEAPPYVGASKSTTDLSLGVRDGFAPTFKLDKLEVARSISEIGVYVKVTRVPIDNECEFSLFHTLRIEGPPAATRAFLEKNNPITPIYYSARFKVPEGGLIIAENVKLVMKFQEREVIRMKVSCGAEFWNMTKYLDETFPYTNSKFEGEKNNNDVTVKVGPIFADDPTPPNTGTVWSLVHEEDAGKYLMQIGKPKMNGISGIYFVLLVGSLSLGVLGRFSRIRPVIRLGRQEIDLTIRLQSSV